MAEPLSAWLENQYRKEYGEDHPLIVEIDRLRALANTEERLDLASAWAEDNPDEAAELVNLETAFDLSGGRGIEIADRIDELRAQRDAYIADAT